MRNNIATVFDEVGLMFVRTEHGTYTIDVKSGNSCADVVRYAVGYLGRNFKNVILVDNKEYRKRNNSINRKAKETR